MISRETIEEILVRTDIQSLIGSYVSLKRAGSNLKGLCPFHSEKTPSFTVYPSSNSFYCFGCSAGGDQISFIMKMEHLDYPDAVEFLAKRAGITVEEHDSAQYTSRPKVDKKRLYEMNATAARYFHAQLFSDDPEAREALSYFTEKRKLSVATIKHFGLGYAPNSFDKFSKFMLSRGYSYDELVTGFLCGKSESGRYFDAFRNRVMFPIIDVSGNVIAFGGRVMDDSKPKYKNSSDTPVFKKTRNLFALNFARTACEESLILCEGYMDVIALHSAGITNAVATLGTAITAEQARLMSRYTKSVIISYDSDEAGQRAAARALRMLEEVGLTVSVLSVPGAKDPDEYIKTYGVNKFREVISGAKSKFEYNLSKVLGKYDINLPQDKINALHELENIISAVYSVAERDVYIQTVSKRLSVDASAIRADVDRIIARNAAAYKRGEAQQVRRDSVGYSDRVNPDFIKAPTVARNEENVLGLLLEFPEHRRSVFEGELLTEDDFFTELGKQLFLYLKSAYASGDEHLVTMSEVFSDEQMGRAARMRVGRMALTANGKEVLLDSIARLKNSMEKKAAESTDTIAALDALLQKKRNG
ncbi:MAG: DNA primase [Clostridia bacterium]|nr:DNA primase [Clostridia bacterium]